MKGRGKNRKYSIQNFILSDIKIIPCKSCNTLNSVGEAIHSKNI